MTTAITNDPAAAPETASRSRTWGDTAFHLASLVAAMPEHDRGGLAGLRRMDPDEPDTAAFWRLMAGEDLLGIPAVERKWGLILHGIALMTRTAGGDDVSQPFRPQRQSARGPGSVSGRRSPAHDGILQRDPAEPVTDGAGRYAPCPAGADVSDACGWTGDVRLARNGQVHFERRI